MMAMTACGLDVVGSAISIEGPADSDADSRSEVPTDASSTPAAADDGAADAAVDADADTGTRDAGDAACDDAAACARVVFVSSAKYRGDLGGIAGADAKCAALAAASVHPRIVGRTFVAWIGTAAASPATRLSPRGSFVRVDGATIANSYADLVDGTIDVFIDIDEKGVTWDMLDDDVWTGVKADGTAAPPTCLAWTSASGDDDGTMGLATRVVSTWTEARTDPCDEENHLFCVEQ